MGHKFCGSLVNRDLRDTHEHRLYIGLKAQRHGQTFSSLVSLSGITRPSRPALRCGNSKQPGSEPNRCVLSTRQIFGTCGADTWFLVFHFSLDAPCGGGFVTPGGGRRSQDIGKDHKGFSPGHQN
jgi:hypothetical protein